MGRGLKLRPGHNSVNCFGKIVGVPNSVHILETASALIWSSLTNETQATPLSVSCIQPNPTQIAFSGSCM